MLKFIIFCSLLLAVFCKPSKSVEKPDEPDCVCGISPALEHYGRNNTDKILEGHVSRPGDWPWVISLYSSGQFECTSTLIGDKWILTAGHCVLGENVTTYQAFAGSNKLYDGQEIFVEKLIPHPLFSHPVQSAIHDIALIKVSKVSFTDKIKPICLSSRLTNLPRSNSIGVGWGRTWNETEAETETTNVLREDYIPIEPWKHCDRVNETIGEDSKTEICIGKGLHSPYFGDSGGPLMVVAHNKFYEVGVTSRGLPSEGDEVTDDSDMEGIYTLVPAYCNWIAKTTNGDVKCE